jgi:hypothetical protein
MPVDNVPRLRVGHGLIFHKPLLFLSGCQGIYTGFYTHPTILLNPNPGLPVLLQQIQDATAAHQDVGKLKGAVAARTAKFVLLRTSIESEVIYVQGLIDASPELGPSLVSAANMKILAHRSYQKPIIKAKSILPSGSVLLECNATLLDKTHRAKSYCWQHTLDGKTFLPLPTTPTGTTTVHGLPPLTTVGFQVAVLVRGQPLGPWSQTVSILIT